jgi:hypothetical protein
MLYAFWLVKGLVVPRAASKQPPLPGARLLGYTMAVTLEEKLDLVELLLLQESELHGADNLAPQKHRSSQLGGPASGCGW